MSDIYGGGIYLNNNDDVGPTWDIAVNSAGDIKTVTGEQELQKDVAYNTARRILQEFGQPLRPIVLNRIRARVRDALENDPRIDTVIDIDVTTVDSNSVEIVASVDAVGERVELVYEVSE